MGQNGRDETRRAVSLSVIAASLNAISENSEPGFMKIGRSLQSIYSDATELTRQTLEAVKLIGEESEEGLLVKVKMLVNSSMEKVKDCQATASGNHNLTEAHVKVVTKNLNNSFTLCSVLKKTAKYLRAVGLQMRVECSRSAQSMEMFSVVAQEIGAVAKRFMETAEEIRKDSETARQDQISANGEISESIHQLFRLVGDTEQTVQSSMGEIEQLMCLSLESLERAGARSRSISQHTGKIVMGIQFHDHMRQRIEHISKALFDAEKLCMESTSSSNPITPSEESKTATAILKLQKAQLQNIIREVNAVHESAGKAFRKIGKEIDMLTQSLSSFDTEHPDISLHREGKLQDPFESLKSGLGHLHQLIDQSFSLVENMYKTGAQASEAVTGLSSQTEKVRELSFETHLTAINAIIKAKQLGKKGLALDKLVQEARSVSDQSNIFVEDIEEIHNLISDSAKELQARIQEKISGDEAQISLYAGLEDISKRSARFRKKSLDAFKLADALKRAILSANTELDFLPALADRLAELLHQLEEMSRSSNLVAGQETDLTQERIDEIRETYTMQEERSIHEKFIDQHASFNDFDVDFETDSFTENVPFFESSLSTSSEDSIKDLDVGDNVELF